MALTFRQRCLTVSMYLNVSQNTRTGLSKVSREYLARPLRSEESRYTLGVLLALEQNEEETSDTKGYRITQHNGAEPFVRFRWEYA